MGAGIYETAQPETLEINCKVKSSLPRCNMQGRMGRAGITTGSHAAMDFGSNTYPQQNHQAILTAVRLQPCSMRYSGGALGQTNV